MSLGTKYSPQSPWEGPQVANFDQCLHIVMVIWKCTDVFRGMFRLWGGSIRGGYVRGTSLGGLCHGEENFNEWSTGFSSTIKKRNEKINMKKFFN